MQFRQVLVSGEAVTAGITTASGGGAQPGRNGANTERFQAEADARDDQGEHENNIDFDINSNQPIVKPKHSTQTYQKK